MGSKVSPTVIGAFVVGAIICMVAGGLLFFALGVILSRVGQRKLAT